MTSQPDTLRKAVRVLLPLEFHLDSSVCVREFFIFFYSGSSATLSPCRSGPPIPQVSASAFPFLITFPTMH